MRGDLWILVERRTGAERPELGSFTSASEAAEAARTETESTGVECDIRSAQERTG